jgi:AcrR family transcriptional regulator
MFFASTIAVVVRGQIVVHSESLKARITTLPRNDRSETCLPNWSVSANPGAWPDRLVPGSSSGLFASVPDVPAPLDVSSVPATRITATAATATPSQIEGRRRLRSRWLCSIGIGPYSVKFRREMGRVVASGAPRRARRRTLDRDLILDAAIALIERDGPGGLTMRRLGAALGVEGMAIYHHFDGRDELLAAIGERLLSPLNALELGDEWREACRRFAITLRDIALTQPATFQLVGLEPFDSAASLQPLERLLEVLITQGFRPPAALAIYRVTASFARAYALAEAAGFTVDAARPEARRRLASLPPSEFPILAGRASELADLDSGAAYDLGVQALLSGLADPGAFQLGGGESPLRIDRPR